ncbi:MAG TPA: carboxypeptidase regulatory-like domain-containing protein [Bryobacteraceae bacterium]|nr:carboxypeptidase regulatory-like domain-containing protein [Bryobacteraceae bacterium]
MSDSKKICIHSRCGASALLVITLTLAAPCMLKAQFTSTIEGRVTDPSDAAVPNAEVTLENQATGVKRVVRTSDVGYYRVASLPPGQFTVRVSAQGFDTAVYEGVLLENDQTKTFNIQLKIGAPTTQVSVVGEVPLVETGEARISGHIQERQVSQLPLVGRNFMTLVVLTPGVTGLPSGGGQAYAQATGDVFSAEYGVNLNANGQRAESNNFQVDNASVNGSPRGGVSNFSPSADAVQELRVSVNNFSAEYGRNSSASVNVITKSGSNEFHGTAAWYHTNNHLTARNSIFQPQVPVFRRNEANATIGGPILKNKLFFFGSVDVLRSGLGQGFSSSAITPEFASIIQQRFPNNISAKLVKDFPSQLNRLSDGLYAGPTAGAVPNVAACSGLSNGAATPVDTPVGPLPCNLPLTFNGTFAQTLPRNGLQWFGRVDHVFHEGKDRLYGSVARTTLDQVAFGAPSVYPAFTAMASEYTAYWNVNYTHIFSPTIMNEASWSGTRAWGADPVSHGEVPLINVTGIASYGTGFSDAIFIQNNQQWQDVVSINRGSHAFKTGGIVQCGSGCPGAGALFHNTYGRVVYTFPSVFDFVRDDPFSESNIGFDPKTGKSSGPDFRPVFLNYGAFIQDDWKAKSNLTLSLGLRWEVFANPWDKDNLFVSATFPSGSNYSERIANLTPQVKQPHDVTKYSNFAPRIGIAWDPFGKAKTSIRAGVGVFYDRAGGQFYRDAGTSLPVIALASVSKQTAAKPVYGLATGSAGPGTGYTFPAPPISAALDRRNGLVGVPSDIYVWDPNMKTMRTINYFFGIQQSIAHGWAIEANYVGSQGRNTYMGYDVNRYAGDLFDGRLDRLNTSFAAIQYGQARGSSFYNGGNVSVRKRYSAGLDMQVAYTYGKAIDDASSFGLGLSIVDVNNLKLNRALADFDIRQKLSLSLLYETPRLGRSTMASILSRWELGAVTILQSGRPFSVVCTQPFDPIRNSAGQIIGNRGCDYNADGFNYDFPNAPGFGGYITGIERSKFLTGIFQASDFSAPPPGQPGTLGRNTYFGPGYANTNFNIIKRFPFPAIGERGQIDFRTEFFNLFNRVNLGQPTGNLSSSQFGKSTTALGARNVQFGVRIAF